MGIRFSGSHARMLRTVLAYRMSAGADAWAAT